MTEYFDEDMWMNIAPGSHFEIEVESKDECTAAGTIQLNGGMKGSIPDKDLRPGPATVPLTEAGGRYRITVRLSFVKAGQATVTARCLQPPDDWVHPNVFHRTYSGAPGDLHRAASFVALMT